MPIYEYRCETCDETFELRRDASQSSAPASCAAGHPARRVLSVFATVGRGASSELSAGEACGPNCACAAGF